MTSLNNLVKQCSGLVDTSDVSDWENNFLKSILERTNNGDNTTSLSEKQIDVLQKLFDKHFSN